MDLLIGDGRPRATLAREAEHVLSRVGNEPLRAPAWRPRSLKVTPPLKYARGQIPSPSSEAVSDCARTSRDGAPPSRLSWKMTSPRKRNESRPVPGSPLASSDPRPNASRRRRHRSRADRAEHCPAGHRRHTSRRGQSARRALTAQVPRRRVLVSGGLEARGPIEKGRSGEPCRRRCSPGRWRWLSSIERAISAFDARVPAKLEVRDDILVLDNRAITFSASMTCAPRRT